MLRDVGHCYEVISNPGTPANKTFDRIQQKHKLMRLFPRTLFVSFHRKLSTRWINQSITVKLHYSNSILTVNRNRFSSPIRFQFSEAPIHAKATVVWHCESPQNRNWISPLSSPRGHLFARCESTPFRENKGEQTRLAVGTKKKKQSPQPDWRRRKDTLVSAT